MSGRTMRRGAALVLAISLAGCSNMNNTEQRALTGTVGGAGVGAIIGAIGGNAGLGALVGAGAGLAGGLIYDHVKKERRHRITAGTKPRGIISRLSRRVEGRKRFFFEKKNQKTLSICLRRAAVGCGLIGRIALQQVFPSSRADRLFWWLGDQQAGGAKRLAHTKQILVLHHPDPYARH
jgi:hypothetical protein